MRLPANSQFGQYRIQRLLGRGGMGEVYEVEHATLARPYALKLLPEEFASQPDALARFRREAKVMANLDHPHIVRVDDFGETDGRYWLRMELVKGVEAKHGRRRFTVGAVQTRYTTLDEYAAMLGGSMEQGELADILKQLLEALAYAHAQGIVHRDLKPGNILLEADAQGRLAVKIADFGLARVMGDEYLRRQAERSASLSLSLDGAKTLGRELSVGERATLQPGESGSTRSLVGTWEYMAPEQRRGEPADARSDVYAVGLMCYRLLTGKGLALKLPSELVPGLTAEWDPLVSRAMEQDAAARFANGREMLTAAGPLLGVLSGKDVPVESRTKAVGATVAREALPAGQVETPDDLAGRRFEVIPLLVRIFSRRNLTLAAGTAVLICLGLWARDGWNERQWRKVPYSRAAPWTNSLGMKFVPVPGTRALFSIWETRLADYQAYADACTGVDQTWLRSLQKSDISGRVSTQDLAKPVAYVSWRDAQGFCRWLTEKERQEGRITPGQSYRLPTDAEWSVAVGLPKEPGRTPKDRDRKTKIFPWGAEWPPPKEAGNVGTLHRDFLYSTMPVGSFDANAHGLYDLSGNVAEWCEDTFGSSDSQPTPPHFSSSEWKTHKRAVARARKVARGGSCVDSTPDRLWSSSREAFQFGDSNHQLGFRVVLAGKPNW